MTHKQGRVETRGRKRSLSATDVDRLDNARSKLIRKAGGTREATMSRVASHARVDVQRTAAARALAERGSPGANAEKPPRRSREDEKMGEKGVGDALGHLAKGASPSAKVSSLS